MRRRLPFVIGGAVASVVGLGVVFVVFLFATSKLYRIPSSAMEPTLHCAQPGAGCTAGKSDRIIVWKALYWFGAPDRGDVVAFKTPPEARERCGAGGTFVKRIVGMPGEVIEERSIDGRGFMFVNGKRLSEPYVEADGATPAPTGRCGFRRAATS